MTRDLAIEIIEAYEGLIDRALNVISDVPFRAYVDSDNRPHIAIDGDTVILSWKDYESDYYGGGYLRDEEARLPVSAFLMSADDLSELRKKVKKEEAERAAKVAAAQEAVRRERAEAHDRAEWARLRAKFGS